MTNFVRRSSGSVLAIVCGSTFALIGCGGGAPTPASTQQQTASSATQMPATQQPAATAAAETSAQAGGTKWLGKVPYDVFYDRPLDKIGQAPELGVSVASVAAAQPQTSGTMAATQPADGSDSGTDTPAPSSSSDAWSSVISGEVLDAESKVIRSRLSGALQSLSTYNRSIDAITNDAIIMSALAGVAEKYDADMRWKDRAPVVRTLAYEIYENVGAKGRKAFTATQEPFEKMATVLNGGNVDGVDVEEDVPFADYADRSSLMARVDSTFKWLRSTIVSDANLKSNQEDVVRQASVLAMIAAMIKHDSYDYHEEKDYQKFCGDFLKASRDASSAAEQLMFTDFQDAVARIGTSCNECHNQYAFGDDGL